VPPSEAHIPLLGLVLILCIKVFDYGAYELVWHVLRPHFAPLEQKAGSFPWELGGGAHRAQGLAYTAMRHGRMCPRPTLALPRAVRDPFAGAAVPKRQRLGVRARAVGRRTPLHKLETR
jgi:hypothetical protein